MCDLCVCAVYTRLSISATYPREKPGKQGPPVLDYSDRQLIDITKR